MSLTLLFLFSTVHAFNIKTKWLKDEGNLIVTIYATVSLLVLIFVCIKGHFEVEDQKKTTKEIQLKKLRKLNAPLSPQSSLSMKFSNEDLMDGLEVEHKKKHSKGHSRGASWAKASNWASGDPNIQDEDMSCCEYRKFFLYFSKKKKSQMYKKIGIFVYFLAWLWVTYSLKGIYLAGIVHIYDIVTDIGVIYEWGTIRCGTFDEKKWCQHNERPLFYAALTAFFLYRFVSSYVIYTFTSSLKR